MALDGTYGGLKSSVAAWLTRDDLTALIPDFITLAEARLNDILRLAPMEKKATINLSSSLSTVLTDEDTGDILTDESTGSVLVDEAGIASFGSLPSNILEIRVVIANTSPAVTLRLSSPAASIDTYGSLSGYPVEYTIVGDTITIYQGTTATIDLIYYERIPTLSDESPENWLLTKYPQMYLYASLLEATPLLRDDPRIVVWKSGLDQAVSDARVADIALRWGNSGFRIPGPTP